MLAERKLILLCKVLQLIIKFDTMRKYASDEVRTHIICFKQMNMEI